MASTLWHYVTRYASPKYFYERTQSLGRILGLLGIFLLTAGFISGLFLSPIDYQQGHAFRMIYVHVPAAFLSMFIFSVMGILSFSLMIWRVKIAGLLIKAMAPIGASMALMALITGSIWGKPMWGTYWVWDARLTSELVLLMLYLAILAVSEAYQNTDMADKMMGLLCIVGLLDLPIIHYSVYWWQTLHQGATLTLFSKPKIHGSMLYPLLISLAGFLCYACCLIIESTQTLILWREKNTAWVARIIQKEVESADV